MQIKVTDTRMQEVKSFVSLTRGYKTEEVPVVEGKLVFVECDIREALLWMNPNGIIHKLEDGYVRHSRNKLYKPIIISETEKIEKGDWCYVKDISFTGIAQVDSIGPAGIVYFNKESVCYGSTELKGRVFKILTLPKQFSPKHLQAIVDGKMKDGDKVLVECEDNTYIHEASGKYWEDEPIKMKKFLDLPEKYVKVNSSSHVTLHKVEEKLYTREEVRRLTKDAWVQGYYNPTTPEFEDWFEQNVK